MASHEIASDNGFGRQAIGDPFMEGVHEANEFGGATPGFTAFTVQVAPDPPTSNTTEGGVNPGTILEHKRQRITGDEIVDARDKGKPHTQNPPQTPTIPVTPQKARRSGPANGGTYPMNSTGPGPGQAGAASTKLSYTDTSPVHVRNKNKATPSTSPSRSTFGLGSPAKLPNLTAKLRQSSLPPVNQGKKSTQGSSGSGTRGMSAPPQTKTKKRVNATAKPFYAAGGTYSTVAVTVGRMEKAKRDKADKAPLKTKKAGKSLTDVNDDVEGDQATLPMDVDKGTPDNSTTTRQNEDQQPMEEDTPERGNGANSLNQKQGLCLTPTPPKTQTDPQSTGMSVIDPGMSQSRTSDAIGDQTRNSAPTQGSTSQQSNGPAGSPDSPQLPSKDRASKERQSQQVPQALAPVPEQDEAMNVDPVQSTTQTLQQNSHAQLPGQRNTLLAIPGSAPHPPPAKESAPQLPSQDRASKERQSQQVPQAPAPVPRRDEAMNVDPVHSMTQTLQQNSRPQSLGQKHTLPAIPGSALYPPPLWEPAPLPPSRGSAPLPPPSKESAPRSPPSKESAPLPPPLKESAPRPPPSKGSAAHPPLSKKSTPHQPPSNGSASHSPPSKNSAPNPPPPKVPRSQPTSRAPTCARCGVTQARCQCESDDSDGAEHADDEDERPTKFSNEAIFKQNQLIIQHLMALDSQIQGEGPRYGRRPRPKKESGHGWKQPQERPRDSDKVALQKAVRKSQQKALGIKRDEQILSVVDPDEDVTIIAEYLEALETCEEPPEFPTRQNGQMILEFDYNNLRSKSHLSQFNNLAFEWWWPIFIQENKEYDTEEHQAMAQQHFFNRIDTLAKVLSRLSQFAGESSDECKTRLEAAKNRQLKSVRQNQRRERKFSRRYHAAERMANTRGSDNEYEDYRFEVIKMLGPDGCSSEESVVEQKQVIYRQKKVNWRPQWIDRVYKEVDDQIAEELRVTGARPGNAGGKREGGGGLSRRAAVLGLPVNFYSEEWLMALTPAQRQTLKVLKAFEWGK